MMAVVSVGFSSCGDDDANDNYSPSAFSIVGKWKIYTTNEDSSERLKAIVVFNSDKTGTFEEFRNTGESFGEIERITYALNGNVLSLKFENESESPWNMIITVKSSTEFFADTDNGWTFKKQ